MLKQLLLFALWLLTACSSAFAFDTETHALITAQAYSESILATDTFRSRFGLDRLTVTTPFNLYWYSDMNQAIPFYYTDGHGFNTSIYPNKWPESFERCQMQEFLEGNVDPRFRALFADTVVGRYNLPPSYSIYDPILPIKNWLVRGAIREDDTGVMPLHLLYGQCGPQYAESQTGTYPRSLHHFYDPYLDAGLLEVMGKSVDWALGYVDSFASSPVVDMSSLNHYSYVDARNLFWNALTRERYKQAYTIYDSAGRQADAEDRMHLWATMFRSLGDVVHLLEDMGQPQHTRNDPHSAFNSAEQQAFEDYANDRVLGISDEAALNGYMKSFFGDTFPKQFIALPPINGYPVPMFATPLRFFTTRGDGGTQQSHSGLGDYTNRGFFTAGTMNGATGEPLPSTNWDTDYVVVSTPCEQLSYGSSRLKDTNCYHFTAPVRDNVAPSFVDQLPVYDGQTSSAYSAPPLASLGVMAAHIPGSIQVAYVPTTVMGLAELDTTVNLTIPRAVGYATGMLDFFFRGQLEVTAPDDGIYAILNDGTPHDIVDNGVAFGDGGKTFGFEKVRLKVKNSTLADGQGHHTLTESGTGRQVEQTLAATKDGDITQVTGPYLVAIARYHRNACYHTDLSGEYSQGPDGTFHDPVTCTVANMRSAWPEISVSQSVAVAAGALDGTDPQLLTFDFSNDPIPVNATDVFLQVAYRGPIGGDAGEQDGIAVGIVDVSEPTYYSVFNNTDYVLDPVTNLWRLPTSTEPPPTPLTYIEICSATGTGPNWKNWQIYRDNSNWQNWQDASQPLPPGHVVRVAMLMDPNTTATFTADGIGLDQYGNGPFFDDWEARMSVAGKQRQATDEQGTGFNPDPFSNRRSVVLGDYVSRMTHIYGDHDGTNFSLDNAWPLNPSYWTGTPQIQPLNSENIGEASAPGATACTFNYTVEYPQSQETAERITTGNVSHRHASATMMQKGAQ